MVMASYDGKPISEYTDAELDEAEQEAVYVLRRMRDDLDSQTEHRFRLHREQVERGRRHVPASMATIEPGCPRCKELKRRQLGRM